MKIDSQIAAAFEQIPLLQQRNPDSLIITRLSGYSNFNYRLQCDDFDWVLRVPKVATNQTINRHGEAVNQQAAAILGLAPECLWRNSYGLSLTQVILPSRDLTCDDLRQQSMVDNVVESISTLHSSAVIFHGKVEVVEILPRYFSMLSERDRVVLQPEFDHCQRLISTMRRGDELRVPSHNDLVLENMLLGKAQLWFIDWEYSAMASPYWDLAIVCNAAGFNDHSSVQFLARYNMGSIALDPDSLKVYRRLLTLLSDCWMRLFTAAS